MEGGIPTSPNYSMGRRSVQQSLTVARSAREKLAIIYNVSLGDLQKMLPLDRLLRRAQATGRVEWMLAVAERALLGLQPQQEEVTQLPPLPSSSSSSRADQVSQKFLLDDPSGAAGEFTVNEGAAAVESMNDSDDGKKRLRSFASLGGGSPMQLLRKMRAQGMLVQRPEEKRSVLSISTMNILLQKLHRDCSAALSIIFSPEHRLTCRIAAPPLPADFKTFVFEAGMTPRAAVATLLNRLFDLKYLRRDFEKFEQVERNRGERAELVRFETTIRTIIHKMFYAQWCLLQQGLFALREQNERICLVHTVAHEERQGIVACAFVSFEYAIRKDFVEAAEERHRWQYISYHMQTREHFARRSVVERYWVAQRILELERDFAMAAQVMLRIFRRALVGYRAMEFLKLVDLESTYRRLLMQRECALRRALFEAQEQLYRSWLEDTILTWLSPVVERIAAKAISDGRVLLALEMREMRNVRAREEARLRVLLRQNSSVHF
jgi:hypothetical protein